MNEVETYTDSHAILVLVGNKADSPDRKIEQEELTTFLSDKNLQYYETSAKTGQNVREMFTAVATQLAQQTPVGTGTRQKGEMLDKVL